MIFNIGDMVEIIGPPDYIPGEECREPITDLNFVDSMAEFIGMTTTIERVSDERRSWYTLEDTCGWTWSGEWLVKVEESPWEASDIMMLYGGAHD